MPSTFSTTIRFSSSAAFTSIIASFTELCGGILVIIVGTDIQTKISDSVFEVKLSILIPGAFITVIVTGVGTAITAHITFLAVPTRHILIVIKWAILRTQIITLKLEVPLSNNPSTLPTVSIPASRAIFTSLVTSQAAFARIVWIKSFQTAIRAFLVLPAIVLFVANMLTIFTVKVARASTPRAGNMTWKTIISTSFVE